jgi:riboflavin kinase/FMN adenylyltransferase
MGDRRGRKLGFPTANVRIGPNVDLADGVYAGVVELEDATRHRAAISVGRRPHYYEVGERLVEAHLLDFDRDLYGERIRVEVGTLVREQRSFGTEGELVEQIASDVAAIRVLRAESPMSSRLPGAPPN